MKNIFLIVALYSISSSFYLNKAFAGFIRHIKLFIHKIHGLDILFDVTPSVT
jgi:hypothetical protein